MASLPWARNVLNVEIIIKSYTSFCFVEDRDYGHMCQNATACITTLMEVLQPNWPSGDICYWEGAVALLRAVRRPWRTGNRVIFLTAVSGCLGTFGGHAVAVVFVTVA